ncbi:MAG TPA: sigma-70 family RNA polymerase sigma factor [Actinomycetota bacterium]|nr:sigma-70 family RNA polymerase sigma factor [Actinomycetota bacterium]
MGDGAGGRIPPFEAFVERHRRRVYRFLLVAVGPGEADDVFQETFLAALRAYPRLRDAEHLDRWIFRIATRKAIDAHRSRRRRPLPAEDAAARADLVPAEGRAAWDGDDPLWRAVRSLPPRQRAAVVQRLVLDRPYAEIAEALGSSEEAVRANVSQGVRRLRALLSGEVGR